MRSRGNAPADPGAFARRVQGTDVRAACAALSAYLDGSELADVVKRRVGAGATERTRDTPR
jgi:hypothetical protein